MSSQPPVSHHLPGARPIQNTNLKVNRPKIRRCLNSDRDEKPKNSHFERFKKLRIDLLLNLYFVSLRVRGSGKFAIF